MRDIKIVFTKSKKKLPIFSWLIRLWTWKDYSHVAMEVDLPWISGPMYFQASDGQVNYEFETYFNKKHEIVYEYTIQVTEEIYKEIAKTRLEYAGEQYGTMQNAGIVYTDIMKLLGKTVTNPWKKGKNCSEILYETVFKRMYPELEYDQDKIKPHHIEDIILEKCCGQK